MAYGTGPATRHPLAGPEPAEPAGNVHVVLAHIESWISNGGVPYPDPTGSGDSVTAGAVPPLLTGRAVLTVPGLGYQGPFG